MHMDKAELHDSVDRHSLTWRAVEEWLLKRRQHAVDSLINGSLGDDKLRGEIRVIDDLISDSQPKPAPEPPEESDY